MKAKERLFAKFFKHLLFPERCFVCDEVLFKKHVWGDDRINCCPECFGKIRLIKEPVCSVCGRPVMGDAPLCSDCQTIKHEFISGKFPISYECIAKSVYRFKYNNKPFYAKDYGRIIYEMNKEWIEYIKPDAFIPVPLHKKRLIKRGYNQAAELSKALTTLTGIPTLDKYVVRIRNTVPQKVFDRKHRQINMKKAFIVPKNDVKLKTVIVVDDIFTTGSTIDAISRELRHQGTNGIYFITITAAGT